MIQLIIYVIILSVISFFLYKYGTKDYDYFEKQNIKCAKAYPFIGSNYELFKRTGFIPLLINAYNKFENEKLYGSFDFLKPVITLRDPELIKQITIKDFDHFTDHNKFIEPENDDLFGNMLSVMKGKHWKEMRSSLSPAFTGNKMRLMCDLIKNCGQQLIDYINDDLKNNIKKSYDIKDMFSRYTNDVIASCAFGLKCDSLKNPNNEFYSIGQIFSNFQKSFMMIIFLMLRVFPKLSNKLNITFFNQNDIDKFRKMILETMKIREEQNIIRPDMINILMELKRNSIDNSELLTNDTTTNIILNENDMKKISWTDNELVAQCLVFFFAGFETTSSFMNFLGYEIAVNPDIQDKLYNEILSIKNNLNNEEITYDIIKKMKYMDMVILETLRKWPPAIATDRSCTKDYTYEDDNGLKFTIKKDMNCLIPIIALHRDKKYFDNPDKFDPERFNDDNKAEINASGYYLPFGIGPRNCIGSRFALLETKILLFYILSNFKIEVSEETQVPVQLKKTAFALVPEKPIKLYFQLRSE